MKMVFTLMKLSVTNFTNALLVTDGRTRNAPRVFILILKFLSAIGLKMLTVVLESQSTQTAENPGKEFSQFLENVTPSTNALTATGK